MWRGRTMEKCAVVVSTPTTGSTFEMRDVAACMRSEVRLGCRGRGSGLPGLAGRRGRR
jgi:hypothetical protein